MVIMDHNENTTAVLPPLYSQCVLAGTYSYELEHFVKAELLSACTPYRYHRSLIGSHIWSIEQCNLR